MKTIQDETMV